MRTWCSMRSTIVLSSVEAELLAAATGTAKGLSVQSLVRDLGCDCELQVHLDSSAAIDITRRAGTGTIHHLDTRLLQTQGRVRSGDITML